MAGKSSRAKFKTRWYHRKPAYWFRKDRARPAGLRDRPDVVRFDPEPGVVPSGKPPVRIFLGTEPMQARAERVFLWSVKQRRDPSRAYEIHLMKDLKGFDRTGWTTGFTNYRYAIPHLAGEAGRAIYNDVDQIYLRDPAELFDLDMGDAAILCVARDETSVSLIDCAKMAPHWRLEHAQSGYKRKHFLGIIEDHGLWGALPPDWNAMDDASSVEGAKCYHFTTLRTQPWRPFEDQLRYADRPQGEVWFALEREADAARFNAFTRERPGAQFAAASARLRAEGPRMSAAEARRHAAAVADLVNGSGATSILDCSAAPLDALTGVDVRKIRWGADGGLLATTVDGRYDGVVAVDTLSRLPEEDVPWALDELFAAAEQFIYVAVPADMPQDDDEAERLSHGWWRLQLELAEKRNPRRRWRLATREPGGRIRDVAQPTIDRQAA